MKTVGGMKTRYGKSTKGAVVKDQQRFLQLGQDFLIIWF